MMQWLKILNNRNLKKDRGGGKQWDIIYDSPSVLLNQPPKYSSNQLRFRWVEMQVKVLNQIQALLPNTQTYIRFSTLFPKDYSKTISDYHGNALTNKWKQEKIFLFTDNNDHVVFKSLLKTPVSPYDVFGIVLESNKSGWQEIISKMFAIIKSNEAKPMHEYQNKLADCKCVYYSLDEDLILDKVELNKEQLLPILENVAYDEDLELVIKKGTN